MKAKQVLLTVAIALLIPFFVGYGIEVIQATPEHDSFCPRLWDITTKEDCNAAGGWWRNEIVEPVPKAGLCQNTTDCFVNFENARKRHDMVVFIVSMVVGLGAVVGGYYWKKRVSAGIIGGGVLLLLYGTVRYWQHANDLLKFILLGVALAVLIWLGYKKLDSK